MNNYVYPDYELYFYIDIYFYDSEMLLVNFFIGHTLHLLE